MSFNFALTRTDTGIARKDTGEYVRSLANQPIGVVDTDDTHIGAWVPKTLMNIWRNSQNTGGSWVANDWGIGSAFTRMRTLTNASGTMNEFDTGVTPSANSWATWGFWAKSTDGNKPDVGDAATRQLRLLYGGSATVVMMSEVEVFTGIWFFCYQTQTNASPSAFTGFSQNTSYTGGVPVQFSEVTIVTGQTTLNWYDSIQTTGASATRAMSDIRTTIGELANFQCKFRVDAGTITGAARWLALGLNDNNRVGVSPSGGGNLQFFYQRSGSTIWNILTSGAITPDVYEIIINAQDGDNYFYLNGVKIGSNTSVYSGADFTNLVLFSNIAGTSNNQDNIGALAFWYGSGLTETELLALDLDV